MRLRSWRRTVSLERVGGRRLCFFIPAVWQENRRPPTRFYLNLWDGCVKNFLVLIGYAGLLIVLSLVPCRVEPEIAADAFLFGIIAGVLCLCWGALGMFGFRRRIGAVLTLGVISFTLLSLTVIRWLPSSSAKPTSLLLTVLITVMLLVTLGLLRWLLPHEESDPPNAAGERKNRV